MCGIAGIVPNVDGPPPCIGRLRAMCDAMIHRGPDDSGLEILCNVALGMRRLSIIDLDGGHQPIHNEDGTVRVVFNGEIYNYRELRRRLENNGHRFATASDTEVIVHLWEELGAEFPKHLNGMFAIALHDAGKKQLVLARDHLGIKPLYYAAHGDTLVFGSEIKVLLASGLVPRELDVDALGQFLAWEYIPGEATLLRHVKKLRPAEILQFDLRSGEKRISSYWDVPERQASSQLRETEWEDEVDATLRECVQRQLVSDVPLGAFLSGGVDSSLVVAAMGSGARTFSIGFDDPTYNEVPWSQRVASSLGVAHRVEIIKPRVVDLFDRLMHFMDDPIGDFSIFPTYLVSQLARQHVKVALSGDGGDELFGGYETYLAQEAANCWMRVPALVRSQIVAPAMRACPPTDAKKGLVNKTKRFLEGFDHDEALGHARWRLFVGETMRAELFTAEARAEITSPVGAHLADLQRQAGGRDARDRALYMDLRSYLVDNCLVKVDRMSMACSLEARVPLLDKTLVELAFRMPSPLKYSARRTKILLKRVARRHVPEECVYRPKQGFSIPIKTWLREDFRPLTEEFLARDRIAAEGLFEPAMVEQLKREHLENRANHSHVLWALLVFEDWRQRWRV
jgi:asparagine synthase (glutamine-hydrolysing)